MRLEMPKMANHPYYTTPHNRKRLANRFFVCADFRGAAIRQPGNLHTHCERRDRPCGPATDVVWMSRAGWGIGLASKLKLTGVLPLESKQIEEGLEFVPKFNAEGLIPAIAQDAETGEVLMVAWMNREALDHTIATGRGTYYSRSRKKLWKKGEESGHVQQVRQILVDCDQDCLILKVTVDAGQCHVGYQSCFYRALKSGSAKDLELIAQKTYDPKAAYKK